jgi:Mn2+/Fe2+ NRAMP family transporter
MNDKTLELLQALAQKLNVTTEYLWAALIKQAYIEGITILILDFIFILIAIKLIPHTKNKELANTDAEMKRIGCITLIIGIIIFVLISSAVIPTKLFNPEFEALSYILKQL